MKREDIKVQIIRMVNMFPTWIQGIVFRSIIETRYLFFKMKLAFMNNGIFTDPTKIYWISPNRIKLCLSPKDRKGYFNSEKVRGSVVDGDWDETGYNFADTIDVYKAFRKRVKEGIAWRETEYYRRILKEVKSGNFIYGIRNTADLDKRCEYLDSLYENIKENGYRVSRNIYHENISFGEIDVNIGRNGNYIFRDGIHRLSIAKILELKYVPVTVFARHKKWQDFRNFLLAYSQRSPGRELYQPPIHPDLSDIPHYKEHEAIWKAIKHNLKKKNGIMIDIGANIGFYCHKFENLCYKCYAIERDSELSKIMERIRIAENKKFQVVDRSIFEGNLIREKEFDVVLALNVFHNFLKTRTSYLQLINLLKNLKTKTLFFELSIFEEDQMKDAYVNFTETEFVDFLQEYLTLSKFELIYTIKSGRNRERHVFKLSE